MNRQTFFILSLFLISGCISQKNTTSTSLLSKTDMNILDQVMQDCIQANATYLKVTEKFGRIEPFITIVRTTEKHIKELKKVYAKYEIPLPADTWEYPITAPESKRQACIDGISWEKKKVQDIDSLIFKINNEDVLRVLTQIRDEKRNLHLPPLQICQASYAG